MEKQEFRLIIELENRGPGMLENLQVTLSIPEGLSVIDGTREKQFASLAPSQSFIYDVGLRADMPMSMLDGKTILASFNHSCIEGKTHIDL